MPAHVQAAWDGFDRGADPSARPTQTLAEWLPGFFEVVVAAADSESHWCAAVLPDQHPRLVLRLLAALFQRISKGFKSRLMSACATGESRHHCGYLHCCFRQGQTEGRSLYPLAPHAFPVAVGHLGGAGGCRQASGRDRSVPCPGLCATGVANQYFAARYACAGNSLCPG